MRVLSCKQQNSKSISGKPREERFLKRQEWKNRTNDAEILDIMRSVTGPLDLLVTNILLP